MKTTYWFSMVGALLLLPLGTAASGADVTVKVINTSKMTVKVGKKEGRNGPVTPLKDVAPGKTEEIKVPQDTKVAYEWGNGDNDGNDEVADTDQTVVIRDPGIEVKFTQIDCLVGDDEGPHSLGDEVEFHANIDIKVNFGEGRAKELNSKKNMYVEGLDDKNAVPLGDTYKWVFAVPAEDIKGAILTINWSDVWEEDNASSSKDDPLFVDEDVKQFEGISGRKLKGKFHVIGTPRDPKEADAELNVNYEIQSIDVFELSKNE